MNALDTIRKNRLSRLLGLAAALGVPATTMGGSANVFVDLELSLVTDVSGSVGFDDYQAMLNGYSAAFRSPRLINFIESGDIGAIAVNLVFFASDAMEGIPFQLITNASEADAFASQVDTWLGAKPGGIGGSTDIADGIDLGLSTLNSNNYDGTRVVIDVAGDGTGTSPGVSRDNALNNGVDTINGIVIGEDPDGSLRQFYSDEVIGGDNPFVSSAPTFQEFEPRILEKLEAEVTGIPPVSNAAFLLGSSLQSVSVSAARATTQGVGGRLSRLRSGVRTSPVTVSTPAPSYSAKGGMAKGGMPKSPIVETHRCPWEVYGGLFYSTEDIDQQFSTGLAGTPNFLVRPDTDITTFGGWVGFDYDFNDNWTAGFAVSGARSDVDMAFVGTSDIDTLALIPYVSYYRDAGSYAAWADLQYAYGMNDYDITRFPAIIGSPEGNFHNIEFNIGINLTAGQLVHGPFGQLRWLDGDIDSYQEIGVGGGFIPEQDYESLATQLGYQVSYQIPQGDSVWVPNATLAWEHEFEADQGNFLGVPLGEVDEDLLVAGLGLGWYTNCGWNASLDYRGRFGSDTQGHYVGGRVGKEF